MLLGCGGYGYLASVKNASKSACLTHLHTIHTALAAYAIDSDGNLPPYAFGPIGGQTVRQADFIGCLVAQGLKRDTWFCPSDDHARSRFKGAWTDFSISSYGMPPTLLSKGKTTDSGEWSLSMPGDSSTILLCDQPFGKGHSAHGAFSNAVFGDGHIAPTPSSHL